MSTNIMDVLNGFQGATIAGIDTCTEVKLQKRLNEKNTSEKNLESLKSAGSEDVLKNNPMVGNVKKTVAGNNVMLFTNKNSNAYQNMVKRRLEAEGKNPEDFTLGKRAWGERIPETPIVRHEKDGVTKYYLEMIFNRAGEVSYTCKGDPIEKEDIYGLPPSKEKENSQGGLDNKVAIRTVSLDSITAIRYGGKEYHGPFTYAA